MPGGDCATTLSIDSDNSSYRAPVRSRRFRITFVAHLPKIKSIETLCRRRQMPGHVPSESRLQSFPLIAAGSALTGCELIHVQLLRRLTVCLCGQQNDARLVEKDHITYSARSPNGRSGKEASKLPLRGIRRFTAVRTLLLLRGPGTSLSVCWAMRCRDPSR